MISVIGTVNAFAISGPPILRVAYQKNTYYFIYEIMTYKYGGKFCSAMSQG